MIKNIIISCLSILLIFGLGACKNDSGTAKSTDANGETTSTENTAPKGKKYDALPDEMFTDLFAKVDEIDLIAYKASLSMNFGNQESVRYILQLFTRDAATLSPSCEPIANLSLTSKGEIYREMELFFHNGCAVVTFVKDRKIEYANVLSLTGIDFFKRFIPENKKNYTEKDIEKMKKAYQQGDPVEKTKDAK